MHLLYKYLFIYLQPFVKTKTQPKPTNQTNRWLFQVSPYTCCTQILSLLTLPVPGSLWPNTAHDYPTELRDALSFCLDFWFGLFLFPLSVYLIYPSMDLLISLHSWLYAISPVYKAVERSHTNYHGDILLHLSSVEWRSCCDLCWTYRWHTYVEQFFFYSSPCAPKPVFTLS